MTGLTLTILILETAMLAAGAFGQNGKLSTLALHLQKNASYEYRVTVDQKISNGDSLAPATNEQHAIVELALTANKPQPNGDVKFNAVMKRIAMKQYFNNSGDEGIITMDTRDSLQNVGVDAGEFHERFTKHRGITYTMELTKGAALSHSTLDSEFSAMAGARFDQPIDESDLFAVLPDHEVNVGGSWHNTVFRVWQGVEITTTSRYTLRSVSESKAEIEVSQTISASAEGGSVTGSGAGTFTVDEKTGMTTNARISTDLNAKIKEGDIQTTMKIATVTTVAAGTKKH